MITLDKSALPDPVRALRAESSPQETSLCNGCSYAFRFTEMQRYSEAKLNLTICCTHPALGENAREVYGVTACNGFSAGSFEAIQKALDVDPYEEMSDEQRALHLEDMLDGLEEESTEISKAMEMDTDDAGEGSDEDSAGEGSENEDPPEGEEA